MDKMSISPIGRISVRDSESVIERKQELASALTGLDGFGCIQVLWWFDGCDNEASRFKLTETSPYKKGLAVLGTFATRSPERPNPIAFPAPMKRILTMKTVLWDWLTAMPMTAHRLKSVWLHRA